MHTLLSFVTAASAHNPTSDQAIEPFVHNGVLAGAWTTAGLVRIEGSVGLEVCDAALPDMTDAWLAPDGRFLRTGSAGLEESTDGGCGFVPRPDVPAAVGLTDLGDRFAATTNDPLVAVYLSYDDGLTFSPAAPLPREVTVESIGDDEDGTLFVTADSATGLLVLISTDGGTTWIEDPGPPATTAVSFEAHGVGPGGGVLVTGATLLAQTSVWESSSTGWVELATLPLDVRSVACIGSTCLATLSDLALLRWDATFGTPSATLVKDAPPACLVQTEEGTVWGCNPRGSITLFGVTTDGFTFTQDLAAEMIAPRSCPPDTSGALDCVITPPPPGGGGTGGTDDPDVPPPTLEVSGGCCDPAGSAPAAAALPLLLVAAKLRRTRRSLARPAPRP